MSDLTMTFSLGNRQAEELELLVQMGRFGNKSEVVRQAIEALFASLHAETRMQAAVLAYHARGATVSRAAELAGVGYFDMKQRLQEEGLLRAASAEGVFTPAEEAARQKLLGKQLKKKK